MRVRIFDTADQAAAHVHDTIIEQLTCNPGSVLGFPTGGSPLKVYAQLIETHRAGGPSWKDVTVFNLDEYAGLAWEDPTSYASYMRTALFDHVDCSPGRRHIPNGTAPDIKAEAVRYEKSIEAAGGIDLLFLGLGRNGHIAFNEPGATHDSRTRVVELAEDTIAANARFFFSGAQHVPREAITMGIGTIFDARRLILLATGIEKSEAVKLMLEGGTSVNVPATSLKQHKCIEIILDREAATELRGEWNPI